MLIIPVITICLLLMIIFYTVSLYNSLVEVKQAVSKNWANIDVILKQRNSELPKLIDSCKQYMQYEKGTLEKIIQDRQNHMNACKTGDIAEINKAEIQLKSGLNNLFALAENYPDLKSNTNFLQLQGRISDLESSISDRRELYNESVNINNTRIQEFPDKLLARLFNFKPFELLSFGADELKDVEVGKLFNN
ncbi:MAG: LemA family protein [Francisellaceae bacterium]|nr:LemA family protein [Francisellaceae bacterium]